MTIRIKLIGDITLNPIIDRLKLLSNKINLNFDFVENLPSVLYAESAKSQYDLTYIHFDNNFKKHSKEYLIETIEALLHYSNKSDKPVMISNCFTYAFKPKSSISEFGHFIDFWIDNPELYYKLRDNSNIYMFDLLSICSSIGIENSYNYNLGLLYQMPYTKILIDSFAKNFLCKVEEIILPEKKVIILDCDNTLWGGIVGEDGVEGLKISKNADGLIYYQFQEFIAEKKRQGFILCLCSKNNLEDVKEVFIKRKTPLQWSDFVIKKVNWSNKVSNIKNISKELNLGLSSFIFFDDNDFELNSIKSKLPDVATVKFEKEYTNLIKIIQLPELKKKIISKEDINKTNQYLANLERKKELETTESIDDYITSLEIKIKINKNEIENLGRLSQLTEKTNQFNFNKETYTSQFLRKAIEKGELIVYSMDMSDKYGDYGTIGEIIIKYENKKHILENMIMSCRALGRNVELDFFDFVVNDLQKSNIILDDARFNKTSKNKPAMKFYEIIQQKYFFNNERHE